MAERQLKMDKSGVTGWLFVVLVVLLIAICIGCAVLAENSQLTLRPAMFALEIEPTAMTENNGFYNIYLTINSTAPEAINRIQLNGNVPGLERYINGTMVNLDTLGIRLNAGDLIGVNFTLPCSEYSSVNGVTVFSNNAMYVTELPASFQPHLVTDLGWYLHNSSDPVSSMADKFTIYGDISNDGATEAQNCTLTIRFFDNQQLLQTSEISIGPIRGFCGCVYLNSTEVPCTDADSVTNTTISLGTDNSS